MAGNNVACAPAAVASAQFADISDDDDYAADDDVDDDAIDDVHDDLSTLVRLPLRDTDSAASPPGALCCGGGDCGCCASRTLAARQCTRSWRMTPSLWFGSFCTAPSSARKRGSSALTASRGNALRAAGCQNGCAAASPRHPQLGCANSSARSDVGGPSIGPAMACMLLCSQVGSLHIAPSFIR